MQTIRVQIQTVIDHLEAVKDQLEPVKSKRRAPKYRYVPKYTGNDTPPKYTDTPVVKPSIAWEARY